MEMVVVLIIMGAIVGLSTPNYTIPTEQARALTAQNNLLAIYSAQQNFNNNYGSYCFSTGTNPTGATTYCGDTLADINTNLGLNIQDNGTYTYSCSSAAITCTATRTSTNGTITLTLNSAINLSSGANPKCNLTPATWCPP